MGRRASVVGAVGGARPGPAVHVLRGRRSARHGTWWRSRSRRSRGARRRGRATRSGACTSASTTCAPWTGPRRPSRPTSGGALRFLAGRCDRLLTVTAPLDLGRPRAGAKVADLNAVIERVAGEAGALVVDLRSWGARNLVMTDHVHPTAFGQIDIAERALAVLERDGAQVQVRPSSLISFQTTRRRRLQADLTYVYRHAKVSARAGLAAGGRRRPRRRALTPVGPSEAGRSAARSGTSPGRRPRACRSSRRHRHRPTAPCEPPDS